MAGMLPGVECARRRRFHNSSAGSYSQSSTNMDDDLNSPTTTTTLRHPLFYPTNFESLMLSPSSKVQQRSHVLNHACLEHNLEGEARVAKQRLDEKFRAQWKLDNPKRKGLFRGLLRFR